jgi:hypothetical protein
MRSSSGFSFSLLVFMRYKNPFGDANNKRWDATVSVGLGIGALTLAVAP